ncbi:MAG: hypothetical protein CMP70_03680 [Flavobacteriales bacterium]|nr:hypothetical protein [Flavobacteriales bacterium]|tara:strand:- start:13756 stop:14958 length:1203 start_codon:yes stop_codon:yes gene_type:complete
MKYALLVLLFIISSQLFSQCDGRYENVIFDKISKVSVVYSDTYDWSPSNPGLEMDIYTPLNDTANNRPLLIFAHGGVYIEGDKNSNTMVTLCEEFAKRGYVTASIRYRLTNLQSLLSANSYNIFSQTVVNSISDMKSAVRYFRKDVFNNNNTFGINPDLIFVGGYSAGAVTAAHLSVIDEGEVPDEFLPFFDESGGIEGNSGNLGFSSEVSGAILLAGAINTTNFLDENDPPIVSVHSTDDNTIDYECASPLANLGISLLDLPVLCGSGKIHDELDNIGVLNDLYTFSFGGHSAPIINLEGTVIPFISDFLYDLICQFTNVNVEELPLLSVYPNPCQNYINVENMNKIKSVIILDMLSNIVIESKLKPGLNKINMSELSRGVYFICSSDNIYLKQLFVKN